MMLELSLFTGAGGGLLGTKLLGWTCIGAVEIDVYCAKVLEARQREGFLDEFPIWNMDIREFNERVAGRYRGMVDVVSAGFPCQAFSTAGKRGGGDDEQNLWPATIECIRCVQPRFVFLENVPGLLEGHGYFGRILGDLAESGYDVRWRSLSAAEMGGAHPRDRVWIMADAEAERRVPFRVKSGGHLERVQQGTEARATVGGRVASRIWPKPDTGLFGVADDMADWLDRVAIVGNGQVPSVVAAAWELLNHARA